MHRHGHPAATALAESAWRFNGHQAGGRFQRNAIGIFRAYTHQQKGAVKRPCAFHSLTGPWTAGGVAPAFNAYVNRTAVAIALALTTAKISTRSPTPFKSSNIMSNRIQIHLCPVYKSIFHNVLLMASNSTIVCFHSNYLQFVKPSLSCQINQTPVHNRSKF